MVVIQASPDKCSIRSTVVQVGVSLVASLGMMLSGMVLAFPSAVLGPLVTSKSPGFHANIDEGSWIASVAAITSPIGCLLGGPLVDKFGRRRGLQVLNIPNVAGWLLLALVPVPFQSTHPLIIGRILTGFGAGLAHCATPSYIAEVASPSIRTVLVTLSPIMMGVGIFIVYLLADLFQDQWTVAACVGCAISMISIISSFFLPETPLWLLSVNAPEKASKSLMTLRGAISQESIEQELTQMKESLSSRSTKTSWKSIFQNMCKPEAYKPLIIMNVFFLFQQLTGITIIIVYGVEFAKEAEITEDAYTVALFIGVIRVISTLVGIWSCARWGRRKPAIITGIGMTISLIGIITYLILRHRYPQSVPPSYWIPAVCILFNMFTSSIIYSTIPWSMLGEVFPTSVRGVSSGLTSCIAYFISFLVIKFFPIVVLAVGNIPVFIFFGVSSVFGTIFLIMFLPETHGKTLQEIEEYFKGSKKRKNPDLYSITEKHW